MKLSTLNSKLNLLSVGTNPKTVKGDSDSKMTAIMYLAPADMSGYDVCPGASDQCRQMCFGKTAGRATFTNVQKARIRKTKMYYEEPEVFSETLYNDLKLIRSYATEHSLKAYIRLNGTSDIDFMDLKVDGSNTVFELFPEMQFYDYTKVFNRRSIYDNYYILYSRSENTSIIDIQEIIERGDNVAVVFEAVPSEWEGFTVIDGDEDDLRSEDDSGVIVGLKAKGLAKKVEHGENDFVIPTINI